MHPLSERRLLVTLAVVASLAGLTIRPAAAAPFDVPDEIAAELVGTLEERYEVITLSRGYVLRPLTSAGFEIVEIEAEGVRVDGEVLGLEPLRELLGDDADVIFALAGREAARPAEARPAEARPAEARPAEAEPAEAGPAEALRRAAERQRQAARELEESIRRQVEELERLDRERVEELDDVLDRPRRRPRRVRSETRVSFGSSLTIEEDESARDVVVIFGPLDVRGEVRGDTVVVFGSVEITGELGRELTVIGGNVTIGPGAVVDGDVTCVGGEIRQASGARVRGEVTEVSLSPFSIDFPGIDFETWNPFGGWGRDHRGWRWVELVGSLGQTIFLALLVLLTVALARRRVGAVADRARLEPWKAGLIGLVVEVLILPVLILASLLLLISVVGIPVLFVLWPLSIALLIVLFLVGYAGAATAFGRSAVRARFEPGLLSPYAAVLIGLLLIQVWSLFGHGLAIAGGLVRAGGYLLIMLGFLLKYLVWTVGLGAVMLDRFSPLPAPATALPPPPPPDLPDLLEDDGLDLPFDDDSGTDERPA